jgi:hypothetical protein
MAHARTTIIIRTHHRIRSQTGRQGLCYFYLCLKLLQGAVIMPGLSQFTSRVHLIMGETAPDLTQLPQMFLQGRIAPEQVWSYVTQVNHTATKQISVLQLGMLLVGRGVHASHAY